MDTTTSTGSRFSEVQVSIEDAAKTFTSTCTSMHFKCNLHLYILTHFLCICVCGSCRANAKLGRVSRDAG